MEKIKAIFKSKNFWGYILTGIGSFLAGAGDIAAFFTGLFQFFE